MAKLFEELKSRLLQQGIAPRHVRRYLSELGEHLQDLRAEEINAGRSEAEAESAAISRIGSVEELTMAMTHHGQFASWCKRAPWAVFGLAPAALLAVLYFIACVFLLIGWKIFLPGAETPFGAAPFHHIYSFENLYFQADRTLYFGAPVLVGWLSVLLAARARIRSAWPILGLTAIALMGATNLVHAKRTNVPSITGHISMDFTSIYRMHGASVLWSAVVHAMVILALTLLPYLVWNSLRRTHTASA